MVGEHRWPVVLLPGGILPAGPAYQALLAELGDDVDARAKNLEMYAGGTSRRPVTAWRPRSRGSAASPTMPASTRST